MDLSLTTLCFIPVNALLAYLLVLSMTYIMQITIFQALLAGLDSKDWVMVCESLNDMRRLSIFHKEALQAIL